MKKIAIFASGSGSDMQSIVDACEAKYIDGRVVVLVTNRPNIGVIDRAMKHNIPFVTFSLKDFNSHDERDKVIVAVLNEYQVDLVVLAGYLSIVTPILVEAFRGRIINIHPSLIPRHCGKGYYGIKVHESVIASGDRVSGATVHYVDEGADTGEIIQQVVVDVLDGDTAETLQQRVLKEEHKLLPKVVSDLCKR